MSVKKNEKDFKEVKETVKKFTKLIIENCHKFKIARQFHGHKYKQVQLPESVEDAEKKKVGYHSPCYKDFSVKKQFWINASRYRYSSYHSPFFINLFNI